MSRRTDLATRTLFVRAGRDERFDVPPEHADEARFGGASYPQRAITVIGLPPDDRA